jgi:ubiquitin carboxyl-terminal hydrolase MINDY-3/4
MPSKKPKDLADAPVYKMTHEEQVQLLSDALLREYMHRRGFRATLKAFDEEHPRDDNTISSRAVMSDLMALRSDDQQRMKEAGVETIMEMLCNLRVERRVEVERLTAEAESPLPKVPARYDALEAKLAERAARKAKKQKHRRAKRVASLGEPEVNPSGERKERKKEKSRRQRPGARDPEADPRAWVTIDDMLGSSTDSSNDDDNNNAGSDHEKPDLDRDNNGRGGPTVRRSTATTQRGTGGSSPSPSSTSLATAATAPTVASLPVRPAWTELKGSAVKKDGDSGEDASEADSDGEDVNADRFGGDSLSEELRGELSAAFQLLCGFDGSLSSAFLEQGFTFDEELDCALIQWRPGNCDAVVAPVQAFVAAYFYEREVYVKKEQRRHDCLLRALTTVLEQAQPNASKVVLIDGAWRLKSGQTRYTRSDLRRQAGTTRARCWTRLRSTEEVRDVLRTTLLEEDRWMKPRGSGLLNFVFSLLLSRGVDVVQKELTAAHRDERPALLSSSADSHATVALANLVLCGRAVSYCHNGVQRGNQFGYPAKLKCGMLTADSPAQADSDEPLSSFAYSNAMEPALPSWVLRHKNHYANLYMTKDTRAVFQQKLNLGGTAAVDVVYWDAATEDDLYPLTVTVRSITLGAGSGVRNANSFVNTAITSVPAWSSAEVSWNGNAPLRD